MKPFQKLSLSRISSGITAVVCAGFLVNAILTNNGGAPNSQEKWKQSKINNQSLVARFGKKSYTKWKVQQDQLDRTVTNSTVIEPRGSEFSDQRKPEREEPSLLSLIRENADVAPSVSSGTGRVSVIVKKGDTLFAIAQRHGLKLNEIARLNGLEEPYTIRVGQTLYVAR
ncbi:MAG: LysM peptidoglycan-binding domain-containing protein [Rhizobiaceae bacterium]